MIIFNNNHAVRLRASIPALFSIALVIIAGCGGGSSSDKTTFQPDQNAPVLDITSPANNAAFGAGQSITFTGTASDEEDGELSSEIEWNSNLDGYLGSGAQLTAQLSAGQHTITASVNDSDNNEKNDQVQLSVNQSTNTAPNVSITAPGNGSEFLEGEQITFRATAQDAEDGNISNQIIWYSDIAGEIGRGSDISNTSLTPAAHLITAEITDSGGITQQARITISVEEATGKVTISWTAPTQNTDDTELTNLAGFKIYYGESADALTQSIDIDNPSQTSREIDLLKLGVTYYFAMTAYNSESVESDLTSVLSKEAQN